MLVHTPTYIHHVLQDDRTFMDMYLVDDECLLEEWSSPTQYCKLHAAERCLLLAREQPEKAKRLAEDLRDEEAELTSEHRRFARVMVT